jgi:signal transduction histidine kinase
VFDPGKTELSLPPGPKGQGPAARPGFYARRLAYALRALAGLSLGWSAAAFRAGRRFVFSLSGQLLILTLVFVMIVEVVIVIPRMAADQEDWLTDRIRSAEIASQAVDTAQANNVSRATSAQLLRSAGVLYLRLQGADRVWMLNPLPNLQIPDEVMDLRQSHTNLRHDLASLWAPWQTLMGKPDRLIHIAARPRVRSGDMIEIVVRAQPLKTYLKSSLLGMLRMSLSISLAAGILVFAALTAFIVRPIQRLTGAVAAFKTNPEDPSATPKPTARRDEIGQIERELAAMQEQVRQALRSRARLAALGQAVSKINHDLRNMLTAAQMASDRLATSADPAVAKALPRLERALDRALSLAQNVLTYGKSDERAPQIQIVRLRELTEAAAEDAGLGITAQATESVRFAARIPRGFHLEADPEQLHRLLVNLMRNARQAIELQPNRKARGRVTLTAIKTAQDVVIIVADNGPGIPERARDKLFQPFTSSATPGGSGLGLAISRELAQLHGGDVRLVQTGPEGTTFEIRLPLKG